jgi:hypothetical protein
LFLSLSSLSHLDAYACAYPSRGSVSQASGPEVSPTQRH